MNAITAALAMGLALCALAAVAWPPGVKSTESGSNRSSASAATAIKEASSPDPLSDYLAACRRDLRRPLFDPPPVVQAPPPKPKFPGELVGAVVEPGNAYGIFRDARGQSKLVSVGQEIEGARLVTLEPNLAVLEFHGEQITLNVKSQEELP